MLVRVQHPHPSTRGKAEVARMKPAVVIGTVVLLLSTMYRSVAQLLLSYAATLRTWRKLMDTCGFDSCRERHLLFNMINVANYQRYDR